MKSTYSKRNGGGRTKFFHTSTGSAATSRRRKALIRLEMQLMGGTKRALIHNEGSGSATWEDVPLTEKDIARIEKEINTLKSRT